MQTASIIISLTALVINAVTLTILYKIRKVEVE